MQTNETIVIFCAHPDDEAIGPGGTIARYAKEGKTIVCVIFTDGEASHFWEKKNVITRTRRAEARASARILGITHLLHLGLHDGKLTQDIKRPEVKKKLIDILKKYKPQKVFTHDADDMVYPDHTAVHKIVVDAFDTYNSSRPVKADLYTFNIWAFAMRERNRPQLFVDITDYFSQKKKALHCFKSQKLALIQLWPAVVARAVMNGFNKRTTYGENFFKIR
ncbi:MAG TPA: PIG-L deacetylase family protein [Acidobacteriota bacterium]|nr:PIG-L deacetylase family protein [Acidobacteriota bacterium]